MTTTPASAAPPPDPVAQLARKVAHELNSPLDGVMRFIALAQRQAREKQLGDIERYLADAEFGLQRMAEILRDLTEVNARPAPAAQRVSLDELLAQAVRTLANIADTNRVAVAVDQPIAPAPAVDVHLYQVLCNLLKNAIEAMPAGGTATMSAALQTSDPSLKTQDSRLILTITDTGPGLAPHHAGRLFQPFFTTKPPGQGMGLGLAICREVLTKLGGTITLTNRTHATGCQAVVELPLTISPATETER